jgi:outer membrane protein assembly factor BamB
MKKLCFGLVLAALGSPAWAQEWTQFRGPNATGISAAKGLPVTWSESDVVYKVKLTGESHSQPVIWGDKIFITSATKDLGKERYLICLSKADGKELWKKSYQQPTHKPGNGGSGFANGSAVVDSDRVYANFVSESQFVVRAFDHSGKDLWQADLGTFTSQHGYGASPMLYDGKVIVTNDQDAQSFIVALDAKTGKTVWKSPRRAQQQGTAYSTPVLLERAGMKPELLLTSQSHGISSIDPKTGAMNWEAKVFDKRAVASPVVAGNLVIGSCGSGAGTGNYLAAVKLGGKGDVTSTHEAYTLKDKDTSGYVPTPLVVGDKLFLVSDSGFGSCVEAATGKILWRERLGGGFFSSPILVDGKIYCVARNGEVVVWEATDQFKLVAKTSLGEGSHSTPCVDGNRLYFKTFTQLICVGGK